MFVRDLRVSISTERRTGNRTGATGYSRMTQMDQMDQMDQMGLLVDMP
jgi:hypothetical protein